MEHCTFPTIEKFLKHIFSEQKLPGRETSSYDVILDCIQLKHLNRYHQLPILLLLGNRKSGKTTFLSLLNELFKDKAIIVDNQEINKPNNEWALNSVICVDEGFIDKKIALEKIKSLSTASMVRVRKLYHSEASVHRFSGWFVIATNDENINDDGTRFFKVNAPTVENDDPMLIKKMISEIPAFTNFLNTRRLAHQRASRFYFDESIFSRGNSTTTEVILADAKFNTEDGSVDETTDQYGQRWTKLNDFGDLVAVQNLMAPEYSALLDDPIERQVLASDIANGITFGFFYTGGKLAFER